MSKPRPAAQVSCDICGDMFVTTNSRARYCGKPECLREGETRKARLNRGRPEIPQPQDRTCTICECVFQTKRNGLTPHKFCSERCRKVAHARRAQRVRGRPEITSLIGVCKCGTEFKKTHFNERYCSESCRDSEYLLKARLSVKRAQAKVRARTFHACIVCDTAFTLGGVFGNKARFCSDVCRAIGKNNRIHLSGAIRRSKRYLVEWQHINRRRVFDRDGWECKLCHKAISKKFKWPHPKSASLDHIVPMARGGGHVYENVQATHLRCNIQKKHRTWSTGEQLRLVG